MAYNPEFDPKVPYTPPIKKNDVVNDTPLEDIQIDFDPESRYKDIKLRRVNTFKVASGFPQRVNIDISDPLTSHVIRAGDTFELISFKFYGTTKLWWAIATANRFVTPFLDIEHISTRIYIPRVNKIPTVQGG